MYSEAVEIKDAGAVPQQSLLRQRSKRLPDTPKYGRRYPQADTRTQEKTAGRSAIYPNFIYALFCFLL